MSRINDLITQHCPDGVEFRSLGDCVIRNVGGGTPSRSHSEYWNGDIPWSSVGDITSTVLTIASTRQYITDSGIKNSSSNIVPVGCVVVAVKIAPGAMRVVESEIAINQDIRGLHLIDEIDPYFLTYYFKTVRIVGNGTIVKGVTNKTLMKTRIPVPPLEVQREIVRILDQFTALEAELEAELEARRRQYGHYRDALFGDINHVRWVPLSQIGRFQRGSSLQKKNLTNAGVPAFHYGQVYTHYGVSAVTTKSFVSQEFSLNKRCLNPGDVFIATTSENEEDLGKAVAWLGNEPAIASSDAYIYRSDADARFISHFFASEHFQLQKKKFVTGTKVKRLSGDAIGKIRIPFPSRSEQEIIADSLDRFDALVNDLSVGLPAELAARRKQYEYYRDKLLTFEEAPA